MYQFHRSSPYAHRQQSPFDATNMLALGPGLGGGVLTGLRQCKTPEKGPGQPGADSKNSKNSQENSRSRRIPAPPTTTQKGWSMGCFFDCLFVCFFVGLFVCLCVWLFVWLVAWLFVCLCSLIVILILLLLFYV